MQTAKRILLVRSHADYLVDFHGPLIRCLVAQGHEVFGACPEPSPAHQAAMRSMGAVLLPFPFIRRGLNPLADGKAYLEFRKTLTKIRPDLALFITIKPIVYGVRAARQAGCAKVFAMLSGLGFAFGKNAGLTDSLVSGLTRRLLAGALRRCDGVLCHNDSDLQELAERGLLPESTPTTVTHGSGVDLSEFGRQPLPASPSVLMVARLVAAKGVRQYVEAARMVRRHRPDIEFKLVGWFEDGPDAINREEIDTWQKEGTLQFLGKLDDVRPALRDCSIFALPTYYREGLPRTILEAMATGRPIITTDIPGCRETVIDGRNGRLIPTHDAEALSEAVLAIVADPSRARAMATESRTLAEARFDSTCNAAGVASFMGMAA